jgi:hypothetical protein
MNQEYHVFAAYNRGLATVRDFSEYTRERNAFRDKFWQPSLDAVNDAKIAVEKTGRAYYKACGEIYPDDVPLTEDEDED